MEKRYMIWWHNYVDEISRDATTLKEISDSVSKVLKDLDKLKKLESEGKIKIKDYRSINPLFIQILDKSIEKEVAENPIVDVD